VFSAQIFQENTFLKTKPNFSLIRKCFPLTNFSNGKQTQESLESGFPETTFRKTNTAKTENTFLETKPNFSLIGKCFSLTEKCFRWLESVFRWPESVFCWPAFLMANKHRKVWKVVSRKVNSGKQTWPKACLYLLSFGSWLLRVFFFFLWSYIVLKIYIYFLNYFFKYY